MNNASFGNFCDCIARFILIRLEDSSGKNPVHTADLCYLNCNTAVCYCFLKGASDRKKSNCAIGKSF